MDGRQRSFVASVHGLQHVERFFATDLAHDNAVGTHTQTVDHQLPLPHSALAFDVWGAGLQPHHMLLLQQQFSGVLDGHDAFGIRNEAGKHIQQSCFAGASAAGDQNIQASLHHGGKQLQHGFGERLDFRSCCGP